MPTNTKGAQINVAPYNRNDGFSPGSSIVARIPGLDNQTALDQTNPVRLTDMSQAFAPEAPIVVIDAETGKRPLIWAELDSNAGDPQHTTLLIHPGKNLAEGHRYVVALRNLKDADGNVLQAPTWFAGAPRRPAAQRQLPEPAPALPLDLQDAAEGRDQAQDLYEAWDFTVASRQSLTSRMLSIRNDAFGQLGDTNLSDLQVQGNAPPFA